MKARVQSIDNLRGAIIIVMALDHVRDFVHAAAFTSSPTDLRSTTAAISSRAGSLTSARRSLCSLRG